MVYGSGAMARKPAGGRFALARAHESQAAHFTALSGLWGEGRGEEGIPHVAPNAVRTATDLGQSPLVPGSAPQKESCRTHGASGDGHAPCKSNKIEHHAKSINTEQHRLNWSEVGHTHSPTGHEEQATGHNAQDR